MPTLSGLRKGSERAVAALDAGLGRAGAALLSLLPRRARRFIERMERQRSDRIGQYAAGGFLAVTVLYGVVAGGHVGKLGDAALVLAGFGIENVTIVGHRETSELAVLEKLDLGGRSLVTFSAAAARARIAELPWVTHVTVRKFYPDALQIEIDEREPFALWQDDGEIFIIDYAGEAIVPYEGRRFSALPLLVGAGANVEGSAFWLRIAAEPAVAERFRAAVRVANRRWDLHLENGVVVKLPERNPEVALARLAALTVEQGLLDRDVVVVDLRLLDRVTVRLPEGQPAAGEEPGKGKGVKVAGART